MASFQKIFIEIAAVALLRILLVDWSGPHPNPLRADRGRIKDVDPLYRRH